MAMSDMFAAMLILGLLGIAADRMVSTLTSRFFQQYLPEGKRA
jgi:ABC-type nitrate/sulfonate/bicarbonate transport system permease component